MKAVAVATMTLPPNNVMVMVTVKVDSPPGVEVSDTVAELELHYMLCSDLMTQEKADRLVKAFNKQVK